MKKILNFIISFFILIYIFLEDITVNLIVKPVERILNKFQLTIRLGNFIKRQHKYVILILFLLPFAGMEFVGLYSFKLFAIKKYASGAFFYIFKFYLTIPTFFIFRLTKPTLTKFIIIRQGYFIILKIQYSKLYKRVINYKHQIHLKVSFTIKQIKEKWKSYLN